MTEPDIYNEKYLPKELRNAFIHFSEKEERIYKRWTQSAPSSFYQKHISGYSAYVADVACVMVEVLNEHRS